MYRPIQTFVESISLPDKSSLTASFFVSRTPRASILLPAAMGVTQNFYAECAQWLAGQDFLAATFDYRGMGLSVPRSLREVDVDVSN